MKEMINGRYRIDNLIGQGGMADVYLAYDVILKRSVAIKIMRTKVSEDPMLIVRFFREASAASVLSHRNIVDIYDVGEDGDIHYIVMEYVKGPTLKRMLQLRGALGVEESISIIRQLAYAINEAHEHHIIHRDIKPQNILIKADGTLKITDFGIAVADHSVSLTHNEAVMGSAQYLPPETAHKQDPNERFDIYSIGIVFFELLAGFPPYDGETPAKIALAHLTQPLPRITRINPEIPVSIENIIRKAAAKDPEERYSSVKELLSDLDLALLNPNQEPVVLKTEVVNINPPEKQDVVLKDPEKPAVKPRQKTIWMLIGILALCSLSLLLFRSRWSPLAVMGYVNFPEVANLETQQALDILQESGISTTNVEIEDVFSSSVPAGQIVKASAETGEWVGSGSSIKLYESRGAGFLVSNYTGMDAEALQQHLADQGLQIEYEVVLEPDKDVKAGTVLRQELLLPGSRIDPQKPHTIRLVVATYPTLTIPEDILGMDVWDAKEMLNAMGAAVIVKNVFGTGQVQAIDPYPGQSYTQQGTDTVITIYY